jgi:hypothetical protein
MNTSTSSAPQAHLIRQSSLIDHLNIIGAAGAPYPSIILEVS